MTSAVVSQTEVVSPAITSERLESVDAARFLAIVTVIVIHTHPCGHDYPGQIQLSRYYVIIDQIFRFAMPFFFALSGYFWGKKLRVGASVPSVSLPMAKRLASVLAFWSVIYLLPYNLSTGDYGLLGRLKLCYANLIRLLSKPFLLLTQGTKIHLWFLIALLLALGIASVLVHKKRYKLLVSIAVLLYVAGVLTTAYVNSPVGIHIPVELGAAPFFGTLPFAIGYFISGLKPKTDWFWKGTALFAVGAALHLGEAFCLWRWFGTYPNHGHVFGTLIMGVGFVLVSLSGHPCLQNAMLARLGRLTLGIYAIQFILVDLFLPLAQWGQSFLWDIVYTSVVAITSVAAVLLLSRNNLMRRFVV